MIGFTITYQCGHTLTLQLGDYRNPGTVAHNESHYPCYRCQLAAMARKSEVGHSISA
jgi:hypothetical protein